jgi:DNA-binding phage protein
VIRFLFEEKGRRSVPVDNKTGKSCPGMIRVAQKQPYLMRLIGDFFDGSVEGAAEHFGIASKTLYRIINGKSHPFTRTQDRIIKAIKLRMSKCSLLDKRQITAKSVFIPYVFKKVDFKDRSVFADPIKPVLSSTVTTIRQSPFSLALYRSSIR